MSIYAKDVALRRSLEEIVAVRDETVATLREGFRLVQEAHNIAGRVGPYLMPYDAQPRTSMEACEREIDRRFWRHAFDYTGLGQVMDSQARQDFERELEKTPPQFSMANATSTLLSVAQQADKLFARGLVNVFLRLRKEYHTNRREPFKVARRVIISGMASNWCGLQVNHYRADEVNDIDRVFKTLAGQKHHARELETAITKAWRASGVYEDEFYQVRGFKNGSTHWVFKRADLLDRANEVIASYYEDGALADGRAAA